MASSQPASLLLCPMCSSAYDEGLHEPKLLPCSHSFCLECLIVLGEGRQIFRCPDESCHKKILVPSKGISALKTNFYIMQMKTMVPGGRSLSPPDIVTDHTAISVSPREGNCDKHPSQALLFFCVTCQQAICMNCTILDHDKNTGHEITDISAAVRCHQGALKTQYRTIEKMEKMNQENLSCIRMQMGNLESASIESVKQLRETFQQLKTKIESRVEALTEEIRDLHNSKKAELMTAAQDIKAQNQRIKKIKTQIKSTLESKSVQAMVELVSSETLTLSLDPIEPSKERNFIQFDYTQGLEDFITSLSTLTRVTSEEALPARTTVNFPNFASSIKSAIKVTVQDNQGHGLSNYPITAEVIDPCDDVITSRISSREEGVYAVQVAPQMPGKHRLKVKFLEQVMWGCDHEFKVKSNNPVLKIGQEGSGNGELIRPTSVAVGAHEEIYVSDTGNKRVQVFDSSGKYLTHFKTGCSYDVLVHQQEVYVTKAITNKEGHLIANTIRVYGPRGEHKRQFTIHAASKSLFMAVNSKGSIILTDSDQNCAYIVNREGILIKTFGRAGSNEGEMNFPAAVSTDRDDNIMIVDTLNHRVQVFTPDGTFVRTIGSEGHRKGQLRSPRGIATDTNGNVLVADGLNRIQVFSKEGGFVSCIDSQDDRINKPYNLTAKDGFVYVADYKNNCVKKYKYY